MQILKRCGLICLLLTLILGVMTACGQSGSEETQTEVTQTEDANALVLFEGSVCNYSILRSDRADKTVTAAAVTLKNALSAVSGQKTIKIASDFDDKDRTDYEIIVGNSTREENETVQNKLGEDTFRIEVVGQKIVIVGKDSAGVLEGVRYFMHEILHYYSANDFEKSEKVTIPQNYVHSEVVQMSVRDPRNPDDILIYTNSVVSFGAMGDGMTDDTTAFQNALNAARNLGGGVVYVPAGQYVIKGKLTVPRSVYLVGEWTNPEENPAMMQRGTLLLATGNSGKTSNDNALITIGASAGVIGLTIAYPNQSIDKVVAYPPTLRILDSLEKNGSQHASYIENVTLVNSYIGIVANEGLQLPTIQGVYMTALKTGFHINGCYDCARITTMHISPSLWAQYAKIDEAKVASYMHDNTTGLIMARTDMQMMHDVLVDSCHLGVSLVRDTTSSGETAGYSTLSSVNITNAYIGICHEYNSCGFSGGQISVYGDGATCVLVKNSTQSASTLHFYDMTLSNKNGSCVSVEEGAKGILSIQNSRFTEWTNGAAVMANGGAVTLLNNHFTGKGDGVVIGPKAKAASVSMNEFASSVGTTVNCALSSTYAAVESSSEKPDDPIAFEINLPKAPVVYTSTEVFNVQELGAKGDGKSDDTAAFQSALKKAGEKGGIVYVPAGFYVVKESLVVPTGVEIRGISEGLHVTSGEGSVILITDNQGEEDEDAFITMKTKSAVRGLQFWYPEQAWNDVRAYPYAIRVMGQDCVIRNICLGNCYQGIDMASADCGGHYVENITGTVLKQGIALDGSTKAGTLHNTHFNLTFYFSVASGTKLKDQSGDFSGNMFQPLLGYLNDHLVAYQFGSAVEEQLLFVFNYRARYGMTFTGDFDGTIVGSAVDGSLCGIKITGEYEKPLSFLTFLDDIVPGKSEDGNLAICVNVSDDSVVRFVSSGASAYGYVPSGLVVLESGQLILDGFDARVTPNNGTGAIAVKKGYAEVNGVIFQHVGPLTPQGAFTQQENKSSVLDIYCAKGAEISVPSAIGIAYIHSTIEGSQDAMVTVSTQ